jgi:hypothetical protein
MNIRWIWFVPSGIWAIFRPADHDLPIELQKGA